MTEGEAPIRVVAAVIDGDAPGEVLAFQRGATRRDGGLWEFPGGKIEPGESPAAALARELREELGAVFGIGALLWKGPIPGTRLVMWFFKASPLEGSCLRTDLPDHDAVRSIGTGEAAEMPWAPGDIPFVERWCAAKP